MNEVVQQLSAALTHHEKVSYLVEQLSRLPQVECPVTHYFAPHVYIREIFMPAGAVVIGKQHRTEHFNIMERGVLSLVGDDGKAQLLRAPMTFVSKAGMQKVAYIHEDVVWKTIHVTDNTDLTALELELTEGPPILSKPMDALT